MERYNAKHVAMAVILVVVVAAGAFFASPYVTVRKTRRVAERGDAEALARYVDFPAVEASVESALTAMLMQEMGAADQTLSEFEAAIVGAFVRPVVDTLVSPAGLSALLNGMAPEFDDAPPVVVGDRALLTMRFEGLSRFVVTLSDQVDAPQTISLIFQRRGLGWRMAAIMWKGL